MAPNAVDSTGAVPVAQMTLPGHVTVAIAPDAGCFRASSPRRTKPLAPLNTIVDAPLASTCVLTSPNCQYTFTVPPAAPNPALAGVRQVPPVTATASPAVMPPPDGSLLSPLNETGTLPGLRMPCGVAPAALILNVPS